MVYNISSSIQVQPISTIPIWGGFDKHFSSVHLLTKTTNCEIGCEWLETRRQLILVEVKVKSL